MQANFSRAWAFVRSHVWAVAFVCLGLVLVLFQALGFRVHRLRVGAWLQSLAASRDRAKAESGAVARDVVLEKVQELEVQKPPFPPVHPPLDSLDAEEVSALYNQSRQSKTAKNPE
jgi:hypothetical protein